VGSTRATGPMRDAGFLCRLRRLPLQILRGAAQQRGAMLEAAEAGVARDAQQLAHDFHELAVIDAEPIRNFLPADRAAPLLTLEHRVVLLGRDPVRALEPPAPRRLTAARGAVVLAVSGILRVAFARPRVARRAAFLRRAPLRRIDLAPILRAFLAALA